MYKYLIPVMLLLLAACGKDVPYTVDATVADSVARYSSRTPAGAMQLDFVVDDSIYFSRITGEPINIYSRSAIVGDTMRIGGHGADYFPAALMISVLKDEYLIHLIPTKQMNANLDERKPPLVNCTQQSLVLSSVPRGNMRDTVAGIATFATQPFPVTDPQGRTHTARCSGRYYFRVAL